MKCRKLDEKLMQKKKMWNEKRKKKNTQYRNKTKQKKEASEKGNETPVEKVNTFSWLSGNWINLCDFFFMKLLTKLERKMNEELNNGNNARSNIPVERKNHFTRMPKQ